MGYGPKLFLIATLKDIGPRAQAAVPMLIEIIHSSARRSAFTVGQLRVSEVQQRTVEALGGIGSAAREAVPLLVELLQGEDHNDSFDIYLRCALVRTLGAMGKAAQPALPALRRVEADQTTDASRRRLATFKTEAVIAIENAMRQPAP